MKIRNWEDLVDEDSEVFTKSFQKIKKKKPISIKGEPPIKQAKRDKLNNQMNRFDEVEKL